MEEIRQKVSDLIDKYLETDDARTFIELIEELMKDNMVEVKNELKDEFIHNPNHPYFKEVIQKLIDANSSRDNVNAELNSFLEYCIKIMDYYRY